MLKFKAKRMNKLDIRKVSIMIKYTRDLLEKNQFEKASKYGEQSLTELLNKFDETDPYICEFMHLTAVAHRHLGTFFFSFFFFPFLMVANRVPRFCSCMEYPGS